MTDNQPALKYCPCCNSSYIEQDHEDAPVYCMTCGLRANDVGAWNTRHQPAQGDVVAWGYEARPKEYSADHFDHFVSIAKPPEKDDYLELRNIRPLGYMDASPAPDAIKQARRDERERCAEIAERRASRATFKGEGADPKYVKGFVTGKRETGEAIAREIRALGGSDE